LLLMPDMGAEQALERAEEVRLRIGALQIEHAGRQLGAITASLGTATAPSHCTFDKLVRTADAALLRAKEGGRNRVVQAALSGLVGIAKRVAAVDPDVGSSS
jgi:diguanylate cyclase (GGDEF)-like protein